MAEVAASQGDTIPSTEWPGADEQHVKVILVNYQDESHLHSFAAQTNSSAIDALGGTSFYVLPAEVVQLGEFSVHFQVDAGPLFTVQAMPPLRAQLLSKHEKELFKKLQAALECIRIPISDVLHGQGRSISLTVSAVYRSPYKAGRDQIPPTRNPVELIFTKEDELRVTGVKQGTCYIHNVTSASTATATTAMPTAHPSPASHSNPKAATNSAPTNTKSPAPQTQSSTQQAQTRQTAPTRETRGEVEVIKKIIFIFTRETRCEVDVINLLFYFSRGRHVARWK
jgi:hypothetical protein